MHISFKSYDNAKWLIDNNFYLIFVSVWKFVHLKWEGLDTNRATLSSFILIQHLTYFINSKQIQNNTRQKNSKKKYKAKTPTKKTNITTTKKHNGIKIFSSFWYYKLWVFWVQYSTALLCAIRKPKSAKLFCYH